MKSTENMIFEQITIRAFDSFVGWRCSTPNWREIERSEWKFTCVFQKISRIPYHNEHKNCSLKLETQKFHLHNVATTEFEEKNSKRF